MRALRSALFLLGSVTLLASSMQPALARGHGGGPGGSGIALTSEAVVPGPGEIGASASAVVSVGHGEVCYTVTIGSLSGTIQEIALYQGAAGQAGPEVLRLTPSPIGIYQLKACAPCDAALARAIGRNPSAYYIQIRTSLYPGGALRGQLQ
jgi:hypothetical protein